MCFAGIPISLYYAGHCHHWGAYLLFFLSIFLLLIFYDYID